MIASPPKLAPGALQRLMDYPWPGNVRELENVVERALILRKEGPLTFEEVVWVENGAEGRAAASGREDILPLDLVNAIHIKKALAAAGGKVHGPAGAASLLGINPSTLRHRMRKLGVRPDKDDF